MSVSLESALLSVFSDKNSDNFALAKGDLYSYQSIFLSKIVSDNTNPRFLPAIIISNIHAYQFVSRHLTKQQLLNIYNAEDKVIIGKSCIVNCCKYGSISWKKANKTIESILELAANVAVSEIIQAPTIYPVESNGYKILTGHRRFFAMIYNYGVEGAAHFKVYNSKPLLLKTKQFQENASREELPQYGKLKAFQDALYEVEILNKSKQRLGQKTLTVKEISSLLGISMGAFDNYNVLTRYPSVITAFENGNSEPLVAIKKFILKTENTYKKKHNISKLDVHDKKEINRLLKAYFNPEDTSVKLLDLTKSSLKTKSTHYKLGNIESSFVIETLLTKNVCEIDCDIDWQSVNWKDPNELNRTLKILIDYLVKMDPTNKEG